jgi:hypothetical protein
MYDNGKMRPVETILRMRGEGMKGNYGVGESKIYCKYFCKCHNVPLIKQYNKKSFYKKRKNKCW